MDAFAWMAQHATGTAFVPQTRVAPEPVPSAPTGRATKRRLMLERIEAAGPAGCTAAELARVGDCEGKQVWSILDADVRAGLLHVRRTTGGRLRWIRGEAPTREIGRAIQLLQRHGYTVTR